MVSVKGYLTNAHIAFGYHAAAADFHTLMLTITPRVHAYIPLKCMYILVMHTSLADQTAALHLANLVS